MDMLTQHFSKILDYYEKLDRERMDLNDDIEEQRENLNDLQQIISEFNEFIVKLNTYDVIESEELLKKLFCIHKYITDLEWHISEISELNTKMIKSS